MKNPVVFISYSHDSQDHQDRVLDLSNKLRSEGIDCILDQYEESPPEGWPRWMEKNIRTSDFVLMICTEPYFRRVMGLEEVGIGNGVKWEGNLIYQHLYNAGTINTRFVPVIFDDGSHENVPTPLQGSTIYNVENSSEFDRLYWRLRGVKREKPELGELRPLPEKDRKTLFLTGFIDVDLWNKAEWKGVAYIHDYENKEPPFMALMYKDKESAIEIFKGWRKTLGEFDSNNELRISIVEGDVEGELFGYYVHVSSYIENTIKRVEKENPEMRMDLIMLVSRIHRMNPEPTSKNLEIFKQRYKIFNSYTLIPGVLSENNKIELMEEFRLIKRDIELRNFSDIKSKNDPDAVLNKKFSNELK